MARVKGGKRAIATRINLLVLFFAGVTVVLRWGLLLSDGDGEEEEEKERVDEKDVLLTEPK